ncbi:LOW QUALITY PROTEIN: sodium-coupled monocarboxylate transporter 2-like [Atheta coriaria]|uniref:LOW QUALITY PROTEIN: sodium-coupled monocarboxylate transporter 2-like n=1 Tax=Dalotia coriaria TaxID=877792 RepID=UPI0031F38D00
MNATTIATTILEEMPQFTWHDYLFFIILLLLSAAIGVYFGFFQKKEDSADEYLLGGKEMGVFEISMSLIASTISGITILSVPSEIYRFGFSYWLSIFSAAAVLIFSYLCVIPVFTKLKTPSTYEYLNSRFDESIRGISSLLFTMSMFLYLPIVIYIPALALAQGTGFYIHHITPLICGVCIFYTTVGGLKAVVWTDALQFVVMIGATLVVTYVGTTASGGIGAVMRDAQDGGRLDLDYDVDPTKRDTLWTIILGMFFLWNGIITFGQGCVQKCLALPNSRKIRNAYIAFGIGIIAFFSFSTYIGLMMYARYKTCDPYMNKKINIYDQILPLYILEVTSNIPGLPGVFIAGVFSASLSTLSAAMNALSCTLYEDFILAHLPKDISQRKINLILKTIVIAVGVVCTALVFVVQKFKSILEIGLTFGSFTQGPAIGLFALGMFVPKANTKGALAGTIGTMLIMGWIIFTKLYYKMSGYITDHPKVVSTVDCMYSANTTFREFPPEPTWSPPFIYRITHYYYGMMGCLLVLLIGIPVSYMTRSKRKPVSKDLISPAMHWALDKTVLPEYYSVAKASQIVVNQK